MYIADTLSRTFLKDQPKELPQKNHAEVHHVENKNIYQWATFSVIKNYNYNKELYLNSN